MAHRIKDSRSVCYGEFELVFRKQTLQKQMFQVVVTDRTEQGAGPEVKHSLKTCCVLATYSDAIINFTIVHYSHKGGFEEPGRTWKTSFFLHGQPEFLPGPFSSLLPR